MSYRRFNDAMSIVEGLMIFTHPPQIGDDETYQTQDACHEKDIQGSWIYTCDADEIIGNIFEFMTASLKPDFWNVSIPARLSSIIHNRPLHAMPIGVLLLNMPI
jgi:hypothetical protein